MNIKDIEQLIEDGQSLKTIAQAYSEIANLKIKRIRTQVERNQLFFQEISQVYALVRDLARKKKIVSRKSKQTVSVLITSNYRFYGNINSDLIDFFQKKSPGSGGDILLIGKSAINYFKNYSSSSKITTVILKKDMPDLSELNALVSFIKDYNQVLIYHSRLKSLLIQQSTVTDITPTQKQKIEKEENFKFIFEPDLPKILSFFDSQILTLLLEATFLESELSRTASRFISMDQAENEANKFIKDNNKLRSFIIRNLKDNQILENYAALLGSARNKTL